MESEKETLTACCSVIMQYIGQGSTDPRMHYRPVDGAIDRGRAIACLRLIQRERFALGLSAGEIADVALVISEACPTTYEQRFRALEIVSDARMQADNLQDDDADRDDHLMAMQIRELVDKVAERDATILALNNELLEIGEILG